MSKISSNNSYHSAYKSQKARLILLLQLEGGRISAAEWTPRSHAESMWWLWQWCWGQVTPRWSSSPFFMLFGLISWSYGRRVGTNPPQVLWNDNYSSSWDVAVKKSIAAWFLTFITLVHQLVFVQEKQWSKNGQKYETRLINEHGDMAHLTLTG